MKVAVAVITDEDQQVLITRRPLHASHGGMWEFPGGKLKIAETAPLALVREIKEEVNLDILAYDYLGEICHTYDQLAVSLLVYHVTDYEGTAVCQEGQMDLNWVSFNRLSNFQFPSANIEIIKLISELFHLEKAVEP